MSDCLYHLSKKRYENVVEYLRSHGVDPGCACRNCAYGQERVGSKGVVQKDMYESPYFQHSLKTISREDLANETLLSDDQIRRMLNTWWNY